MAGGNSTEQLFGRNKGMSFSAWYSSRQKAVEDAYFNHVCNAAREKAEPLAFIDFAQDLFKVRMQGMYGVEL